MLPAGRRAGSESRGEIRKKTPSRAVMAGRAKCWKPGNAAGSHVPLAKVSLLTIHDTPLSPHLQGRYPNCKFEASYLQQITPLPRTIR